MKRILCSLLSILFVIGIWFSVPMNASALNKEIEYLGTYEIEEQIKLYKSIIFKISKKLCFTSVTTTKFED